ncbi:MAG: c-type cytochrome, partial [Alphaproteobacteria bacterium]
AAYFEAEMEDILGVLVDENHWYSSVLSRQDLLDLAHFVGKGQIDMDLYVDPATGMARGDNRKRKAYYTTICATCHGPRGTEIITMDALGRVARNSPWAALHTMMNGHPNEAMPALRVEGLSVLTDVLAYIQTLPDGR